MQATNRRLIPGILALALCAAPAAFAASNSSEGTTSGPAAGSTTVPSTATQKHASNGNATAATGNAGVTAKRGAEGGPAPHKTPGSNNTQ